MKTSFKKQIFWTGCIFFLFSTSETSRGQRTQDCHCPLSEYSYEEKANQVFQFSNGQSIAICGSVNTEDYPITYSEFVLSVCGADTVLGFWGATIRSIVHKQSDSLMIDEIKDFPIGPLWKDRPQVWVTTILFFTPKGVKSRIRLNKNIKNYSKRKIALVLLQNDTATGKFDDLKLKLAHRLLVAAISGSKLAAADLRIMPKRFGEPDGAIAEDFDDMMAMLDLWEERIGF